MNARTNKIIGRIHIAGDGWVKHLRKHAKRRANKASRAAGKVRRP